VTFYPKATSSNFMKAYIQANTP